MREWANNLEFNKNENNITVWNGTTKKYENYNSQNEFTNRKSALGYSFSIQPRIYFESEGLGGSFIGISVDKARYNFSSKRIKTGNNSGDEIFTDEYFSEFESISDLAANFGTQTLYDRISIEYAGGIAIRKITGRRYAYTNDNGGNYIEGYSDIKRTSPAFTFSLKVGYHF
ncbi:MAG: hypothetical protein WKF35_02395 [Ferruginibacter sp.]